MQTWAEMEPILPVMMWCGMCMRVK